MAEEIPANTDNGESTGPTLKWYVLRSLTRANSKVPGYKALENRGVEVFTPMMWKAVTVKGKRKRIQVPVLVDLLFAHAEYNALDDILSTMPTMQFRYARGGYRKPIVIRDAEMEQFIRSTTNYRDPKFFTPEEISQLSIGKDVMISGGALDGVQGKIVNVRGAHKKRILVSIPNLISAVVEVEPEYIELL